MCSVLMSRGMFRLCVSTTSAAPFHGPRVLATLTDCAGKSWCVNRWTTEQKTICHAGESVRFGKKWLSINEQTDAHANSDRFSGPHSKCSNCRMRCGEQDLNSRLGQNNCAISVEELAIAKRNALETTSRWESRAEHAGA